MPLKPRHRYSLRLLLIGVTLLAVVLTFVANKLSVDRHERVAAALMTERRGGVHQEGSNFPQGRGITGRLMKLFGRSYKGSILEVCAHPDSLSDDDLKTLSKLEKLEVIVTNRWVDPSSGRGRFITSQDIESFGRPVITDGGVQQLASLESLECLVLLNTNVTDQGISAVSRLSGIKILHISSPSVTDDAIPHIAKLESLVSFSTAGTSITEEGRQQLRQQLPSCDIKTMPLLVED